MSHREDKKGIGWWTTSTGFVMFKAAGFGTSAYSDYCVPLRFSQTGMLIMIASSKEWVILHAPLPTHHHTYHTHQRTTTAHSRPDRTTIAPSRPDRTPIAHSRPDRITSPQPARPHPYSPQPACRSTNCPAA